MIAKRGGIEMQQGRLLFALVLFALASPCAAADSLPALNCKLSRPPASAGEEFDHGVTLRIYPRAAEIGSTYSGCQTMWLPKGSGWRLVSQVMIEKGVPVGIRMVSDPGTPSLFCRYSAGQLVEGDATQCPASEFLIQRSFPPGCVDKIKAMAAQSAQAEAFLQGCESD